MNSTPFTRNDLKRLCGFLGEARHHIAQSHYLHVGDLSWQLFHMLASHNPSDLIRLWQDEQESLLGFALVYPDFGMFDLQPYPNHRHSELESEMLNWAQSQIATVNPSCTALHTLVNENDHSRQSLLKENHYEMMGEWLYLQRSLTESLPDADLPSSFRLSDMSETSADSRAEALGRAFGAPPRPELYSQFMQAPGYDPTLDVVTLDAQGQVASFAMCWIDPVSKTGQFEPVGTVPEFQRQGLGQAVLREGIRRMREHGMENVIVVVDASEEPAYQAYTSVGLSMRWKLHLYGRQFEISI